MDQKHFARQLLRNMTDAERMLWHHLRAHRLGGQKFRRQQPLGPYVLDFVHFGARLIIEADGGQHSESQHDALRDAWLKGQGFRVLRFWNNDILLNTEGVLAVIFEAVGSPSPQPSPVKGEGALQRGADRVPPLSPRGRGVGGEGANLCRSKRMTHPAQIRIPATYMRGGTSKGVFFRLQDLPEPCQVPGEARDKLFMRVIGSPDPYAAHIDGMGGATSSTSKCVILSKSSQPDHDVDYLYGQVSIDKPFVDWSGNCGNLSTGAGAFAIHAGLVDPARIPENGTCVVRIWQANIQKTIIAHVPVSNGQVQETGDFELDGVTFPAAEIVLEFLDPSDDGEEGGSMFPTGNLIDELEVPGIGTFKATMISAGIPTVFVNAEDIGYQGTELREDINSDPAQLARFEKIRVAGALRMGLINTAEEALTRQHTPKVAFISKPKSYTASSGKTIEAGEVDLLVRALSMGKLHHAMMGTCAVAIGTAAAVPGTLVNLAAGGGDREAVRFGHPSGTLRVGAEARQVDGQWTVTKAIMSRSARVLMEGAVRVPGDSF